MSDTGPVIPRACPECQGEDLRVAMTDSGGFGGPVLLPGLGTLGAPAPLTVVVCRECGLLRLFARPTALKKLDTADGWKRVPPVSAE